MVVEGRQQNHPSKKLSNCDFSWLLRDPVAGQPTTGNGANDRGFNTRAFSRGGPVRAVNTEV